MRTDGPKGHVAESSTYLVTGANRGIGLELARQLSQRGEQVIATARQPEKARELGQIHARIEPLDVADAASVSGLAQRLGKVPIDVLIHNAAIGSAGPRIDRVSIDDLERSLAVNAVGPFRVTQALMPNLEAGKRRTIVGITSGLGSVSGNTSGGWGAYRMSKAALNQLFRTLAAELASNGFTSIVISPGWVKTDMGGAGATLTPRDSVGGILKVLDGLNPAANGQFFDQRGHHVEW